MLSETNETLKQLMNVIVVFGVILSFVGMIGCTGAIVQIRTVLAVVSGSCSCFGGLYRGQAKVVKR